VHAEASGERINWDFFQVRIRADGLIADLDQAYATVKKRINTHERAEFSSLLTKPLAPAAGGVQHLGGTQFQRTDNPDYRKIVAWIVDESGGGEGMEADSLTDNERLFASTVLPELATRQCLNPSCHGPRAPFTGFDAPMPIDGAMSFPAAAVRKNYKAARVHLFLGGDPVLSRLVRKTIPLERGGIVHRGGNDIFFEGTSDPAIQSMLEWAQAEQRTTMPEGAPQLRGIVFVRGSVAPAKVFEAETFAAGSDLWILEPATSSGVLRNLTADAHSGPAQIRDPAVSHDATRIAFAMRRTSEEALNIWEIGLDGTALRQLTHDSAALPGGGMAANFQPTYGPDGRIYFVSSRAGVLADGYDQLDTEIWAVRPDDGTLERVTFDPFPEATPAFFSAGKPYGSLAFTMRRTLGGRFEGVVFRTPLDHNKAYHGDPEIHIHHGVTASPDAMYAMRSMPDGRFACVLLDRNNVWRGGKLGLLERQFGPDLPVGFESESAIAGYRHALTVLSSDGVGSGGASPSGLYRHPVPLPDGDWLVTRDSSALDLADPLQVPDLGLRIVRVEETRAATGPRIASESILVDEAGIAEYDAEPIVVRPFEDDPRHEYAWDFEGSTGTGILVLRHVEMLEAIMSHLPPRGPRLLRHDLVYLRLVESVPITPDEHEKAPVGVALRGRERVLGETPLADGSVFLRVPADRPFRLQFLNADRMAVGVQQNRYNHVAPGETFPGGVSPTLYPSLCSGCHGAFTGDPEDVVGPVPDIVTAASVTLATHADGDPRRPLDPISVGDNPISIDFARDIVPIIERSCVSCHSGLAAAGALDLVSEPTASFDTAYEALLAPGEGSGGDRKYVDDSDASAYSSYLIERIYGRELGAPRASAGRGCPGEPPLSAEERLRFVRWIDLGAAYRGDTP
jgi:hypothetical protein